MASRRVTQAGEALIDILRDPHRGPAGKTGLSGEIANTTNQPCPPWLFDLAVRYARHESPRRNDLDFGPIIHNVHLDVYGYTGDVESACQYAMIVRGKHTATRAHHEAEIDRQTLQSYVGNPNMHRLLSQAEFVCASFARDMRDLVAQAEGVAGVTAAKTLMRLGVDNTIRVMLDNDNAIDEDDLARNGA